MQDYNEIKQYEGIKKLVKLFFLMVTCISSFSCSNEEKPLHINELMTSNIEFDEFVVLEHSPGDSKCSNSYWINFANETCFLQRVKRTKSNAYEEEVFEITMKKNNFSMLSDLLNKNDILRIRSEDKVSYMSHIYAKSKGGRISGATRFMPPEDIDNYLQTLSKISTSVYKGSYRPEWAPPDFTSIEVILRTTKEDMLSPVKKSAR